MIRPCRHTVPHDDQRDVETPAHIHGGLIFTGRAEQALNRVCQIAAAALRAGGHDVVRISLLTGRRARVSSDGCQIRLQMDRMPPESPAAAKALRLDRIGGTHPMRMGRAPYRLTLAVTGANASRTLPETCQRLLLGMLFNMVRATDAAFVEWLSPETVLPADRFLETLDDQDMKILLPSLMPDAGPLVLDRGQRRDPHPDLTLSVNLRDVFRDDLAHVWAPPPPRPSLGAMLRKAADLPLTALRGAAQA